MPSFRLPTPKVLIFDLGGVFTTSRLNSVHFQTDKDTISFDRLTRTSIWMNYESGKISEDECYGTLAESCGFPVAELYDAIKKGRERADYDKSLISFLSNLKESHGDYLKIVLMTNISQPDYQALNEKWGPCFWSVFDRVFTSSENGVRKPSPRFYYKVLQELRVSPREAFFVDDLVENMITAKAIGIRGLLFESAQQTISVLTNLLGDPLERGRAWLKANARKLDTTTDCGDVVVKENYSQLLIYEATRDLDLVYLKRPERRWNFFSEEPKFTTRRYPDDLDTTSLALSVLEYDEETVHGLLDDMLGNIDNDGMIEFYFDTSRPRIDPVISVNVVTLFCKYGRSYQVQTTFQWIHDILLHHAYLDGTRYYPTPEWFLYYVSRLVQESNDEAVAEKLHGLLRKRVQERVGIDGDALCLAMRILVCKSVGVPCPFEVEKLLSLQCEDGGWEQVYMYRFPGVDKKLGNRGVSTAFALKALTAVSNL